MPLHASVSDEARDGWRDFAHANGVTVTALLEVIGLHLANDDLEYQRQGWTIVRMFIQEARELDVERRRRER